MSSEFSRTGLRRADVFAASPNFMVCGRRSPSLSLISSHLLVTQTREERERESTRLCGEHHTEYAFVCAAPSYLRGDLLREHDHRTPIFSGCRWFRRRAEWVLAVTLKILCTRQ
jgi:hypothetical protein